MSRASIRPRRKVLRDRYLAGLETALQARAGTVYGALLVVLALVSKVDVRQRDPQLALQGAADYQVFLEVAVYGLVGLFALARLLADRRWLRSVISRDLGPALQWYLAIGVVCAYTVALSLTPLTVVRAAQLLVLLLLAVLVQRDLKAGSIRMGEVWTAAARTLIAVVVGLVLLGILVPQLTSVTTTHYGYERYRLLQMHPIGSGQLLGLALVVCAADLLVGLRRVVQREQAALLGAAAVLAAALWATKARGVLVATVVAVGVLVLLTPEARRRGQALLVGVVAAVPLIAGTLDDALSNTIVRGQTSDQLMSLTGRTELFSYAWDLIAERPVSGHGYLAARGLFLERFAWAGESHNALVDITISLGIVGLALYGWLFGTIVSSLWRARRPGASPDRRRGAAVGAGLLVWLMLDGVAADSFGGPVGPSVLALVLLVLVSDDVRHVASGTAGPLRTSRAALPLQLASDQHRGSQRARGG